MKADEFGNSWEYEEAKRKQRKQDRNSRNQRRGRKGQWQAKGADE
jgi:hypothetical protein